MKQANFAQQFRTTSPLAQPTDIAGLVSRFDA
ncbi:hypothetical protein DSM3645_02061 [Blastopirellula marina DSM 3645]|uniref:Uncharacterized protein n=1 Tax=Blastopirellula marina DSM 3645 TaxID=314230 RepID=A4A0P7_9BACT|nr:hypothetical protein DSM3645_02061 [Blastopirellula marina DSM 3645]